MEYKIFYAYQSDLPKIFNEDFIEAALNIAISNVVSKEKNIKIKLIRGFRGTSGQKPLAQTMLDQSEGCDFFVGDMSFTSSRAKHIENIKFKIKNKEYLTRIKGEIKWSPNPNVLIETGYSWAKKEYDRTILVMNEAFGRPSDFPVDMKDLRWPILYNLNKTEVENKIEFKRQKESLSNSLTEALNDVIKTHQNYLRKNFFPFVIHKDWPKGNFNTKYLLDPDIKDRILKYRNELSIPGKTITLKGASNSGKSRFAFELFKNQDDTIKFDENINKVFYYDMKCGSFSNIHKPLLDLILLNQHKIIIIDNCSNQDYLIITSIVKSKNLSTLIIQED